MGWGYVAAINSIYSEIPFQRLQKPGDARSVSGGSAPGHRALYFPKAKLSPQLEFKSPVREGNPPSSMSAAEIPGNGSRLRGTVSWIPTTDFSIWDLMKCSSALMSDEMNRSLDDVIAEYTICLQTAGSR